MGEREWPLLALCDPGRECMIDVCVRVSELCELQYAVPTRGQPALCPREGHAVTYLDSVSIERALTR